MYFSQQGEDKFLFEKFLNYKNGFFIELGAMDGIQFSNTLFFERNLGWKGILIEPTNQFNSLIHNRPSCYNFNYAISKNDGEVDFVGNNALGGIVESMHKNHYYGWGLNHQSTYKVQTKPMSYILEEVSKIYDFKKIDFLSLDVEGGELEVLETYNWKIPTYVILIEMSHDTEKNKLCRNILHNNNFLFECELGCNEVWINKNFFNE